MKNTFELVNLTNLTLPEVIDFLTTHFNPREPMHKHLSIPAESFVKSFEPVIKASHQSGYSFAAKTAEG